MGYYGCIVWSIIMGYYIYYVLYYGSLLLYYGF